MCISRGPELASHITQASSMNQMEVAQEGSGNGPKLGTARNPQGSSPVYCARLPHTVLLPLSALCSREPQGREALLVGLCCKHGNLSFTAQLPVPHPPQCR